MDPKNRLLWSLCGKETDRRAWSPFLAYWWEAQPESFRAQGMLEFLESCGADPLLRGFGAAWSIDYREVKRSITTKGNYTTELLDTPVGTLKLGYQYSHLGNTWFLCDHPVKTVEDLKVLSWIYEHAHIYYNPDIESEYARVGNRGLLVPVIGAESKTCFQSLIEKWVGTVKLTYLLADEPQAVEDCLASMRRISDQTAELSVLSPCEAFIFWEDSSTTNISPTMFQKYVAPEISTWGRTLRAAGKLLIHHACGHLRALLQQMGELPIDAIESISPPPTGNIDIEEAYSLLPSHITLIGGIEPVFFENCTSEELDVRVNELLRITRGKRYILANSDSCPPGVEIEKFSQVSVLVKKSSQKPV